MEQSNNTPNLELTGKIEWFEFRDGSHIGFDGDRAVASVEPTKGAPCELFNFSTLDYFRTASAAKAAAEESWKRSVEQHKVAEKISSVTAAVTTGLTGGSISLSLLREKLPLFLAFLDSLQGEPSPPSTLPPQPSTTNTESE